MMRLTRFVDRIGDVAVCVLVDRENLFCSTTRSVTVGITVAFVHGARKNVGVPAIEKI